MIEWQEAADQKHLCKLNRGDEGEVVLLQSFKLYFLSNSYFQFKQFTIQQEKCAMKVTTDGCLFGAIAAAEISNYSVDTILDIGTGTGLLALMIAQQNTNALFDAIEIDEAAAIQAKENVAASPWAERIVVINADILDHTPAKQYDIVISNPPFYEKQVASPDAGRNQAHHSSGLQLQQLFSQVNNLLVFEGKFLIIVPYYRTAETVAMAVSLNLHVEKHWLIQPTPTHSFFRSIFCFNRQPSAAFQPIQICIEEERHQYSKVSADLLQPYYLKL